MRSEIYYRNKEKQRVKRIQKRKVRAKKKEDKLKKKEYDNQRLKDKKNVIEPEYGFGKELSIQSDFNQITKLIKQFKNNNYKKNHITIDCKNLEKIDSEAIFIFISYVLYFGHKFNNQRQIVMCRMNSNSSKKLKELGYKINTIHNVIQNETSKNFNDIGGSYELHTTDNSRNEVDLDFIRKVCHEYSGFNYSDKGKALYSSIGEAIDNSLKHAYSDRYSRSAKWWIHYRKSKDIRFYQVTLIDFGEGILENIKRNKNKFHTFTAAFLELLKLSDDEQVLKKIFAGKHKSSTKDPNQGSGTGNIFSKATIEGFKEFKCITGKYIYTAKENDPEKAEVTKLEYPFPGTLYHFCICTDTL